MFSCRISSIPIMIHFIHFTPRKKHSDFQINLFQIRTPPELERQLGKSVRFTFGESRSAIIEAVKFQSPEDSRLGYFSKYV